MSTLLLPPDPIRDDVVNALQTLLSEKHLYQKIDIDYDKGDGSRYHIVEGEWDALTSGNAGSFSTNNRNFSFYAPNIKTYCHKCKSRETFQAVNVKARGSSFDPNSTYCFTTQTFLFTYDCQTCSDETFVDFIVSRKDFKLQLCGRNPIEQIQAPNFIPKDYRKYYSKAVMNYHAGHPLEGIFMLRPLIEQYLRGLNMKNEGDPRSGEELGKAYNKLLPNSVTDAFPCFTELYGKLSEDIHSASGDESLFEEVREDIERHFDALRLYKLDAKQLVSEQS